MIQQNTTPASDYDRTALIVEPSDAIYFQIATSLIKSGYRVIRAKTGWSAVNAALMQAPSLLIANATLPDQSGWLMTKKLQLTDRTCCVWIYKPFCDARDRAMAKFLELGWLLDYGDDVGELSEIIETRLVNDQTRTLRFTAPNLRDIPSPDDGSYAGLDGNRLGQPATEVA
ncbi:response regulator transcription factor [Novipirellula artificiosorum]|uniref:Response regulatory domain-containing protein n=1 Tax=Novipirellula artificiosorum TaxID=2528016 RepID=A0A5C6DS03_9BACT|nr:response regulator transcription factor [Novipirellula artificiosorum]TWU39452.1 hypothetical protein Poly41_22760 [Novipirellula artificiosorum]